MWSCSRKNWPVPVSRSRTSNDPEPTPWGAVAAADDEASTEETRLPLPPPPLVLVVSGPSGAGKSTLCERLVRRTEQIDLILTATTRPRRHTETDGQDYLFLTREEFEARIEAGDFLEHATVHGNYYGTPVASVQRALERGRDVLLEIDVQGGAQVRSRFPGAVLVYVMPRSVGALRERLEGRGTDSAEAIERRIGTARREISSLHDYDYLVINDDLGEAVTQLQGILASEKRRISRFDRESLVQGLLRDLNRPVED